MPARPRRRALTFGRRFLVPVVTMLMLALTALIPGRVSGAEGSQTARLKRIEVTVGGKTIHAAHADTDAARIEGLLKWDSIRYDQGMLLDFRVPGVYAIHMQGMKFPIDALWINRQGIIKMVYENIRPNSGLTYPSLFPCTYCLEVKAGFCRAFGIGEGQRVIFGGFVGD